MPPATNVSQTPARAPLRPDMTGHRESGTNFAADKQACFKEIGQLSSALLDVEERLAQERVAHADALEQKQAAHEDELQQAWAAHDKALQRAWGAHQEVAAALTVAQSDTQDVEHRYAAVLSSTSWRLTAPLRRLTGLLR